jgi:hypothetical protein
MMIPIPRAGILERVDGIEAAEQVPGIEEISIRRLGAHVAPPPEGDAYLGFIFARDQTPEGVEKALRDAHMLLDVRITPVLTRR